MDMVPKQYGCLTLHKVPQHEILCLKADRFEICCGDLYFLMHLISSWGEECMNLSIINY